MIFKVAENSEGQDAVSRKGAGASINVARRRPQEPSQERPATSSRLRPVEDVRSFSSGLGHITKGRYDRCVPQLNIFRSLKIFLGVGKYCWGLKYFCVPESGSDYQRAI